MQAEPFYLGTLVRYLRDSGKLDASLYGGEQGGKFHYTACARFLGLKDRSQLTNLLDGDTKTKFDEVRDFFKERVEDYFEALPPHLQSMAKELYLIGPEGAQITLSDLLLNGTIQDADFCERYAGEKGCCYTVWRYAGHLETSSRPYKRDDGSYGAWIVRAALEIKPGSPQPTFRIRYKPQNGTDELEIEGLITRVGQPGHMYFWGHEKVSGYPLVMVGKHSLSAQNRIECEVLRKHDVERIFMAKVVLERAPEETVFNDMAIGMLKEDDVAEEIADFQELMKNESYQHPLVGTRCAIVL